MVFRFSPYEILEMARELERRGIDFYNRLMQLASSSSAREIFSFLGEEEKRHLEFFTHLQKELNEGQEVLFSTTDESANYLGAIVESGILDKVLKGVNLTPAGIEMEEALEVGIEIEKESILFYQGLIPMVSPQKREWLDKVVEEEKKHFLRLQNMKRELQERGG